MMFNKEELIKATGAEVLKDSGKSLDYCILTTILRKNARVY